jgi:hypothetical protein
MVVGGVVSGRRPCRHKRAVVLGAVKAKPCGWPLEERPALTAPDAYACARRPEDRAGRGEGRAQREAKQRKRPQEKGGRGHRVPNSRSRML